MNPLPNLNALRVLVAVAETGGFTAAALRLGVTQSAVSKQIAALEAHLARPLFERHHRRVDLTAYGAEVAAVARDAFERMEKGLRGVSSSRPRQLRVVGDADLLQLWLNPRLARFEAAHPEVRLTLEAAVGLTQPPAGAYDVALIWGDGLWPGCVFEPILTNRVFPVVAPDYPARAGHGAMPELAALQEGELIHDQTRFWWSAVMRSLGKPAPGADAGRLYNMSGLCLDAVMRGEGVTIGDEVTTQGHLAQGALICPWPVRLPSHHAYYLARPLGVEDSADVRAFQSWLLAEAADHDAWFARFWADADARA